MNGQISCFSDIGKSTTLLLIFALFQPNNIE